MNIRLTEEMRDSLRKLAKEDGRDLAGYIRRVLELHIRDKEVRTEGGPGVRLKE